MIAISCWMKVGSRLSVRGGEEEEEEEEEEERWYRADVISDTACRAP